MADINKELTQIKTAIYGKDVRGSIHDGIDKINKESEVSKQKADEAHDVMESIINDGFDNAALESNFEQKLDDKIGQLQPEWTQFKNDTEQNFNSVTSQLNDTDDIRREESMISRKKAPDFMVTITDDDGDRGFYSILFKLCKEYNIPMTSAMITNSAMGFPGTAQSDRKYTYAQVMEMRDSGLVEFVSHTHNHDGELTGFTDEKIHNEFRQSRDFLKKWGLNYRAIVFPHGAYDDRVLSIAKEYFDYSTGTGGNTDSHKRVVTPPVNNYRLGRYNLNRPFSEVKEVINEARDTKGWLVMIGHIDQQNATEQDYRNIIEYVLQEGGKFVTLEQGLKYHGNVAQFGGSDMEPETTFSASGKVTGPVIGRYRIYDTGNSDTVNKKISDFEKNTVTTIHIRAVDAGPYPLSKSGVLKTYRYREDVYSYQEYVTSRDNLYFERYWDIDDENWTDWYQVNTSVYLGLNYLKPNESPHHSSKKSMQRKITYTFINSQGNQGYPENKSGLLKTYAMQLDDLMYQEYHIYNTDKVYKRWWDSANNKWRDWSIQSQINYMGHNVDGFNDITKPSEFGFGTTSFRLSSSKANGGLPDSLGGTFTTVNYNQNPSEYPWVYQDFIEYGTGKRYTRSAVSATTWGPWMS